MYYPKNSPSPSMFPIESCNRINGDDDDHDHHYYHHHHHHHQNHRYQKRPLLSSLSYRSSSILILIIMIILFSHDFVTVFGQKFSNNHHHHHNHQNDRISQSINNEQNIIKDFHHMMKKNSNHRLIRPSQAKTTTTFIVEPKNLLPIVMEKNNSDIFHQNQYDDDKQANYQIVKKNNKTKHKTKMSPNLKQFSDLNVDLVFEDSVDVNTTHYNQTYNDDDGDYDDGHNLGTIIMPLDSSESIDGPKSIVLPPPSPPPPPPESFPLNHYYSINNQPKKLTINAKSNEVDLRSKMFIMTKLIEPNTNRVIYTNHYNGTAFNHQLSDLVSSPITQSNSNTIQTLDDVEQRSQYLQTSNSGDHVLRPFVRRTTNHNNRRPVFNNQNNFNHLQYPEKLSDAQHHHHRRNKNDNNEPQWSLPVIELKRLTRTESTMNQSSIVTPSSGRLMKLTTASPLIIENPINEPANQRDPMNSHQRLMMMMFHKRLPLLSNDEGFILTRPNVTDAGGMVEIIENNDNSLIDKRDDDDRRLNDESNVNANRNQKEFKRRFGEMLEPPRGRNFNSFKMNNNNNRGLSKEDVSINDLELDDEFQPSRLKNNNKNKNNNSVNNSGQNNFHPKNVNQNNNNNKPSLQQQMMVSPPPQQQNKIIFNQQGFPQTLHQMMPLFFDKFMAQLSNGPPVAPSPPLPQSLHSNHIDNDIGDLDAPMERRLTGGGKQLSGAVQPPPQPPPPPPPSSSIFANEIIPTGNEFDTNFPTTGGLVSWPKIFRFTDGRINLHDFEREKKRSRIKFSHKLGKSHPLFNIKRDSFLILHGGTFNQ
ncbi:uncharacterized protein LOC124494268 isoform X3 [Dermatophagoides farinae]|uniref:uncharacterized protein LOC124494268 isoform X3 n=1 Tax=Dermatophagoides farinae TaxID=6954 RepID=UPI003F602113